MVVGNVRVDVFGLEQAISSSPVLFYTAEVSSSSCNVEGRRARFSRAVLAGDVHLTVEKVFRAVVLQISNVALGTQMVSSLGQFGAS